MSEFRDGETSIVAYHLPEQLVRRIILLGLLGIFCLSGNAANDGLSLTKALSEAKAQSPVYQRLAAASDEASWKPLEAVSVNLPKLTASANHFFSLKYQSLDINFGGQPATFPLVYPQSNITLGVSWTVFDGFQGLTAFSGARLLRSAADKELAHGEDELRAEISLKYFKALAAQLLLSVAEENVKTLQDHLAKIQILLKGGAATKFDLLRVKVQLEEALPEREASEDNVFLTRRQLAQAMGIENDTRPLEDKLPVPKPADMPKTTTQDLSKRLDILALQEKAEAAHGKHLSAMGSYLPRVGFTAQKDFYNNNDSSLSDNIKDSYSVGVFLTWNLLDFGNIARSQIALHQEKQAEAGARAAVLKASVDLELWRRRYLYNISLFSAKGRAIESAEESVRLAKLGLDSGTRTNTEVLDAALDLFRARAGEVRAQVEAAEALINLKLTLGERI